MVPLKNGWMESWRVHKKVAQVPVRKVTLEAEGKSFHCTEVSYLASFGQPISQTVRGASIYDVLTVGEGGWSKGTDRLHEWYSECQRERGSKNLKGPYIKDVRTRRGEGGSPKPA